MPVHRSARWRVGQAGADTDRRGLVDVDDFDRLVGNK